VSVIGANEVSIDAEIQVNRADFGLTWNWMGIAAMKNTIIAHAVFRRS
jgi:polyisoprenoid-binding protein YceI